MSDNLQAETDALRSAAMNILDNSASSIGHDFAFSPSPLDAFLIQIQVEPLLEQAGALLDRCLADRNEYRSYAIELFKIDEEVKEFFDLHQVRLNEIAADADRQDVYRLTAELSANDDLEIGYRAAATELLDILNRFETDAEQETQLMYRAVQAWISAAPYDEVGAHAAKQDYDIDYKDGTPVQHLNKPDHLQRIAFYLVPREQASRRATLRSQWTVYERNADASLARKNAADKQLAFALADVNFRFQRTAATLASMNRKVTAIGTDGHAMNYADRMSAVKRRYERDLRDAVARILAASLGMDNLFGYSDPLPAVEDLDALVVWLRDAMSFLSVFHRRDQNYVLSLSLRALLGDANWANGLAAGSWLVLVPEGIASGEVFVRLRGVGAAVVGSAVGGLWDVKVRVPGNGAVIHDTGRREDLDQHSIGPVRLGRVSVRSDRPVDIAGVSTVHNASPFGYWEVAIGQRSTSGANRADVDDIVLDLIIASRS